MIIGHEDNIIFFTGSGDESTRTPIQTLIFDIVKEVDRRIRIYYIDDVETIADVPAHEMLIMVTANIFANLAHHIMNPINTKFRLEIFDEIQHTLNDVSKDLFLALQTYFTEDKTKN